MKTWIDEVRDALKWAWGTIYYAQDEPIDDDDGGEALEKIDAAIKAIPDEDPMVILLDWLTERYDGYASAGPRKDELRAVIRQILHMGYKLEEGE